MSARRIILSLLAAPGLALAPLPAQAATITTTDAAHDVVSANFESDDPNQPEPTRDEGDALSMRVTHGTGAVRIRLQAAELPRDSSQATAHIFAFRTNAGRRAELSIYVDGSRWQGQRTWTVNGRERTCRGLRSHIGYREKTVDVVVPRRCLTNPRWVRVGGGIAIQSDSLLYADDVTRSGTVGHELTLGPRIRRG